MGRCRGHVICMDLSLFVAAVLVLAGLLTLEFRISSAIVEVVAGLLLALVVDVRPLGWLAFLADFGILGLMFMAGFEVDASVLVRRWQASLGIGMASFVLPLAGVYGLARAWLGLPPQVAGLLGIGLSTTSLALVYQFLREREALAGEDGQTIFAAAMAVDVLSMVGLALVIGDLGWATAIGALVAIPVFIALPRLGRWVFVRYARNSVEFELRFLLLVLVALGVVAESVGIHAAITSFVVGLILSRIVQDHGALGDKLKGVVFSFLAPVFFLRAGTQIDLRAMDGRTIAVAGALLVVAVALKYLGTAGAARWVFAGSPHVIGVLFNYRLTFGIISATVGLEEGLLDRRLFTAVLLIVLVSAALPMILLRDLPSELSPD
jgi:glutathione-regulated potassium-efflux system ancillary protein KefC